MKKINNFFDGVKAQANKLKEEHAELLKKISTKRINERLLGLEELEKNNTTGWSDRSLKKFLELTREELVKELSRRYDEKTNAEQTQ